ncbi:MAG: cation transporter [Bacteroidetes bacterium]|nr:cation transporter [Bacteroidota bacterium]
MKKLLLLMAFVAGAFSLANAQQKASMSATIKTPTVQCEECQKRIDSYLSKEEGLYKYQINYRSKNIRVWWYTDRTNLETIKTAIANAGYDADDVPANPDSYKKLPLCCKKTEEGGGHKKN